MPLNFIKPSSLSLSVLLILGFTFVLKAQDFPSEIRGYKVYAQEKIKIRSIDSPPNAKEQDLLTVDVEQPAIVDVSIGGVTLEVSARLGAINRSGEIDFMTFRDFSVNGMPVAVEEYRKPFTVEKGRPATLPYPAKLLIPSSSVLRGAWAETRRSKELWLVTGRVFVFGRFKKLGMRFKRVIPVDVEITIRNPFYGNSVDPAATAVPTK